MDCKETRYGFEWGPVTVERVISHHGEVLLQLKTARQAVFVRITPSGLIRVGEVEKVKRSPGDVLIREGKPCPAFETLAEACGYTVKGGEDE